MSCPNANKARIVSNVFVEGVLTTKIGSMFRKLALILVFYKARV